MAWYQWPVSSFPPLGSNNYNQWSIQMKTFLRDQKVWDAIEVGIDVMLATAVTLKAQTMARMRDQRALSFLRCSIDDESSYEIAEAENAKTAWELLKKAHQSADEIAQVEARERVERDAVLRAQMSEDELDEDDDESDEDDEDDQLDSSMGNAGADSEVVDEKLRAKEDTDAMTVEKEGNLDMADETDGLDASDDGTDGLRNLFGEEVDEIENDEETKKADAKAQSSSNDNSDFTLRSNGFKMEGTEPIKAEDEDYSDVLSLWFQNYLGTFDGEPLVESENMSHAVEKQSFSDGRIKEKRVLDVSKRSGVEDSAVPSSQGESDSYLCGTRFDQCAVSPLTLKGIKDAGYERMTWVQEATLPIILKGNDVMAKAKTGTGKTVAFLLPYFEVVVNSSAVHHDDKRSPILVVVICPTRELATQAAVEANKLLKYHPSIGVQVVMGDTSLGMEQKRIQNNPCHILVAMPGRLKDHLQNTSGFARRTMGVKVLVLDEAADWMALIDSIRLLSLREGIG